MPFAGTFGPILPGEVRMFSIDFANDIGAIDSLQSATAVMDVWFGDDPNASLLITGEPSILGTVVLQMVGGGGYGPQPGVTYRLTLTAVTAAGWTIVNYAHIPCNPIA